MHPISDILTFEAQRNPINFICCNSVRPQISVRAALGVDRFQVGVFLRQIHQITPK